MSLKASVLKGSVWTIAGHAGSQLIRLASSVVLTRLLFPEAFGVMSLVWMVMLGLEMLSDVGLGSAIVRDKRGDDPIFLNTVWTVQVIRGVGLWLASCLMAYPVAVIYNQPQLALLIPVAGLSAVISGFSSTAMHTSRRRMEFGRVTLMELAGQAMAFSVVVVWASLYPTVWALVGGALASRLFLTLASHLWLPGIRNRFRWERSSLNVLEGFGKWIFFGSVLYFFSVQSDRMLMGYYLDMAQLGVYGIAAMLSSAVHAVVIKVNYGVLFPAYGKVVGKDAQRLRSVSDRARLGIDSFMILPIAVLMVIGGQVVELLYDIRYRDAGWMLQVLCIRPLMAATLSNSEACLVALGHSKYAFLQNACRAGWMLVSIPVGWSLLGIKGVVWAAALSEVPVVAVLWAGLARYEMFTLRSELRTLAFVALGVVVGLGLLHVLP